MKIDEAVQHLKDGKTVHSANSHETIEPKTVDGGIRVHCTRKLKSGEDEVQIFWLSRMAMLYRVHDFGLGKYTEKKAADTAASAKK